MCLCFGQCKGEGGRERGEGGHKERKKGKTRDGGVVKGELKEPRRILEEDQRATKTENTKPERVGDLRKGDDESEGPHGFLHQSMTSQPDRFVSR